MRIRHLILTIVLILNLNTIYGQIRNKFITNDLKTSNLKGKIKEVQYREYLPKQINDTSYTYKLLFAPFINSHFDFTYNLTGNLSSKIEYYDKKDSLTIADVWKFDYDKKNILLKEEKISYKYPDTTIWNYSYPNTNTVFIDFTNRMVGKMIYRYVQKKEIEEFSARREDTDFKIKNVFYYDKNNRIYKNESYSNDTIYSSKSYVFQDLNSFNVSMEKYIYKGKEGYYISMEYDDKDNVIANYNIKGEKLQTLEYVYDEKNNWIEKKTYNLKGILVKFSKRKIIYY